MLVPKGLTIYGPVKTYSAGQDAPAEYDSTIKTFIEKKEAKEKAEKEKDNSEKAAEVENSSNKSTKASGNNKTNKGN